MSRRNNATGRKFHKTKSSNRSPNSFLASTSLNHTLKSPTSRIDAVAAVGSRISPINLLDEAEEDLTQTIQAAYPLLSGKSATAPQHLPDPLVIIDLAEDEDDDAALSVDNSHQYDALTSTIPIIDLSDIHQSDIHPQSGKSDNKVLRIGNVTCAAGKTVEFADGTFMRITQILVDSKKRVSLIGKLFVRQNSFGAKVPKRRNEVVWSGMVRKAINGKDLVRNRHLIMTNRSYPEVSTRTHPDSWLDADQDVAYGPLFCRWKRTVNSTGVRLQSESWQCLREDEADPGVQSRVSEGAKRFAYRRRATPAGGSFAEERPIIDLDGDTVEHVSTSQRYTFGDAFCGAGGTSCGARMAGLQLKWAFDYDSNPVATYRLNFPESTCHELPVHNFIDQARLDYDRYRVDVLHISPPCQPFSPAHTIPSEQQDEMNQAALFSVGELIESIRPRIVTIEETEGLVSRHGEWFAALLHIFIRIGYSVSWKIVNCGDYGIPQLTRRRLMIIAAGPGEILPEFPAATHALHPVGQLRRIPTIGDRIRDLDGYPNHDTSVLRKQPARPFSEDSYAYTLTCNSGVGNHHPSGLRNYTVRELACLQTFPRKFQFAVCGVVALRRQIGNAVPPEFARTVMRAVIESLMRSDGLL